MKPDVAIIIPVFNRQDYIEETINSVRHQVFNNWECLIIDDGSTDNTIDIIKSTIRVDSRFKHINREQLPKGAATCRNIGIKECEADYIIFLDSDDLLSPYCVSNRLALISESDLDFMVFPMLYFHNKIGDSSKYVNSNSNEDYLTRFISYDFPWTITSPIWRKESLIKLNGFNEDSIGGGQDFELHVRALSTSMKYQVFDDEMPDCFYRIHNGARISKVINMENIQSKKRLYYRIFNIISSTNQLDNKRKYRLIGVFIQQILVPMSIFYKTELNGIFEKFVKQFELTTYEKNVIKVYLLARSFMKLESNQLFSRIVHRGFLTLCNTNILPTSHKYRTLDSNMLIDPKELNVK